MRNTTKAMVSIVSLGLIAASYKFGLEAPAAFANAEALAQAQNSSQGKATPNADPNTPTDPNPNQAKPTQPTDQGASTKPNVKPSKPANSGSSSSASGSGSNTSNSGSASSGSSSSGSSSGSSGSGSNTDPGTVTAVEVTKTGSSIRYRFGTVQVSVTKTDGKITSVNLLQAGATGGRGQAFDFLVQYTLDAQGSSFGNISGATYTTDAYKQSLEAALAQF
ncbi:MAG: FMN-binding protein [Micrococcales bacterium]